MTDEENVLVWAKVLNSLVDEGSVVIVVKSNREVDSFTGKGFCKAVKALNNYQSYPYYDVPASTVSTRLDALERRVGVYPFDFATHRRLDDVEKRLKPLEVNVLNHEQQIGKAEDRFQRHTHGTYSATQKPNPA